MDSFTEIRFTVSELNKEVDRLLSMINTLEQIKDILVTSCKCLQQNQKRLVCDLISKYDNLKINKKRVKEETQHLEGVITPEAIINTFDGTNDSFGFNDPEADDTNSSDEDYRIDEEIVAQKNIPKPRQKWLQKDEIKEWRPMKSVIIGDKSYACARSQDGYFYCEFNECGKQFTQRGNILRHMAVHGAEKQYKCSYVGCPRKFADCSTLKKHILVHTQEKPYKCQYNGCEYSCNSHSGLQVHIRRHTGEKPYKCEWPGCLSAFRSGSNLIEHKRVHTGEKPYSCDWPGCSFRCSGRGDVNKHKRIHTGERPFKCEWPGCQSRCATSSELKQHSRTHTGEKPYKCHYPGCGLSASSSSTISRHIERKHKA